MFPVKNMQLSIKTRELKMNQSINNPNEETICCHDCHAACIPSKIQKISINGEDKWICNDDCLNDYFSCEKLCGNHVEDAGICATCTEETISNREPTEDEVDGIIKINENSIY